MNINQYMPQLTSLFDASDVLLAYLFGSEAKGSTNRESDIDIAVLLSDQIPQAQYGQRVVCLNSELIGIFQRDAIDVALLNNVPPLLVFEVVRYGVVIYDPQQRYVSFYIDTFNRYADTQPLRDLQWQYYLKRQQTKSQKLPKRVRLIMIDPQAIQALLQTLSEYTEDLRTYQQLSYDEVVADRNYQSMIRYALQTAIQSVIGIANHLLIGGDLEQPSDSRSAILGLGRHDILSQDFAQELAGMSGLKNVIVHRYMTVDDELIYQFLQKCVTDFETFSQHIVDYLQANVGT